MSEMTKLNIYLIGIVCCIMAELFLSGLWQIIFGYCPLLVKGLC